MDLVSWQHRLECNITAKPRYIYRALLGSISSEKHEQQRQVITAW